MSCGDYATPTQPQRPAVLATVLVRMSEAGSLKQGLLPAATAAAAAAFIDCQSCLGCSSYT